MDRFQVLDAEGRPHGTAIHLDVDDLIAAVGAIPVHVTKPAEGS